MRDLKRKPQTKNKVRKNRAKGKKQPLKLRQLFHRALRISVAGISGALIVVGAFLGAQLLLASDQFRVEKISVSGGQQLNREQLVALSDISVGDNTFDLDLGLIGRKLEENPWVRHARIERIFPRDLVIRVEERQPVAIINLGYLYYLDRQGEVFKVLEADDSFDFPVITGFDYRRIEQRDPKIRGELQQLVALLANLQGREKFSLQQVSEINRSPSGNLTLFTLDAGVRVRLGREHFARKLDRLERIYAELQPRLPILDYIDLNVDEKVIVRIERPVNAARG